MAAQESEGEFDEDLTAGSMIPDFQVVSGYSERQDKASCVIAREAKQSHYKS